MKSGFVNIIGKPNAGKSTLMNALVGEKLAIVTPKAQTTRHRIKGILTTDSYQIVFSDTPGIIEAKYALHKVMMKFVEESLEDADLLLWVIDVSDNEEDEKLITLLSQHQDRLMIILNKIDLINQKTLESKVLEWQQLFPNVPILPISAINQFQTDVLLQKIVERLPEHPAYFDEDALTDKTERFFAAEILREKVFLHYQKEVPYSTDVQIISFKEKEGILHIQAEIIVERESQKGILIGKGGKDLKKVGTEARKEMEQFFGKKVHLEQFVKVEKDWRKQEKWLKRLGYQVD
ncbi:GTPase Era [Raineya orbicola]|uniref:GTPase Era n=1 Tax=Raineya orbicola TaxID=2016530 RepID=A0A2N3ICG7_9BACT|nr:GTPase Era [Raineya orbicola]PKQ68064.1 era: GTP-binding protein Era [Raineya orbicola]